MELGGVVADPTTGRRGPLPPHTKPVIGAINGPAVTGGLELVLNCDFLVASSRAAFADTHARVGVMPGWGLTVLLPEAIGVRRAREMSVTGNYVDAQLALEWGLVNHVVEHDDLLPFCRRLAADIVSNDQGGVRQMLDTYERGLGVTADAAWQLESEVSRRWLRERHDPARVEERRQAIIDRGRDQQDS
jgi:enoyl-CoA hydratase